MERGNQPADPENQRKTRLLFRGRPPSVCGPTDGVGERVRRRRAAVRCARLVRCDGLLRRGLLRRETTSRRDVCQRESRGIGSVR